MLNINKTPSNSLNDEMEEFKNQPNKKLILNKDSKTEKTLLNLKIKTKEQEIKIKELEKKVDFLYFKFFKINETTKERINYENYYK